MFSSLSSLDFLKKRAKISKPNGVTFLFALAVNSTGWRRHRKDPKKESASSIELQY